MAISLAALRDGGVDPQTSPRLLAAILDHFGRYSAGWSRDDPDLARRWAALDLLRDRWVRVNLGPRIVAGRGCGIDEDGALMPGRRGDAAPTLRRTGPSLNEALPRRKPSRDGAQSGGDAVDGGPAARSRSRLGQGP